MGGVLGTYIGLERKPDVRQDDPLDAGDGRVPEDLGLPLVVIQAVPEGLRFDEQLRHPGLDQGVVDEVIAAPRFELELDLVDIADVPTEGVGHRLDQRGLGGRLVHAAGAAVLLDALRDVGKGCCE